MDDVVAVSTTGLTLTVRAKPGVKHSRSFQIVDIGDGKRAIEIAVKAVAVDGKANKAILDRMAEALEIRKKDVVIVSGETSKLKIISIKGDAEILKLRIQKLLGYAEAKRVTSSIAANARS